jgi:hypothetical protein
MRKWWTVWEFNEQNAVCFDTMQTVTFLLRGVYLNQQGTSAIIGRFFLNRFWVMPNIVLCVCFDLWLLEYLGLLCIKYE